MPNLTGPGETIIVLDELDGTKQVGQRIAFSQGGKLVAAMEYFSHTYPRELARKVIPTSAEAFR